MTTASPPKEKKRLKEGEKTKHTFAKGGRELGTSITSGLTLTISPNFRYPTSKTGPLLVNTMMSDKGY